MRFPLDLRAVGFGVLAAIIGLLAMTVAMNIAVNVVSPPPTWFTSALEIVGNLLPAFAGLVGAYASRTRFVVHGLIAGSVCVIFVAVLSASVAGFDLSAVPSFLVLIMTVRLGSILGSFLRNRRGP